MDKQLHDRFISNQNKGILWNLMSENGAFNGIPQENSKHVKEEFDTKIQSIGNIITPADNIIALNKRTILEMMQSMNKFRTYKNKNSEEIMSQNYNTADIAQQRQKIFDNELKLKQNEFEKFNTKPVPEKIDFADKLDTPIGSEMDKIVAEQIALREKQLTMVLGTQDKNAATSWISGTQDKSQINRREGLHPPANNRRGGTEPPAEPPKLKIGDSITMNIQEVIPERKKVNFAEPFVDTTIEDFMQLLKKTPPLEKQRAKNNINSESINSESINSESIHSESIHSESIHSESIHLESIHAMLSEILMNQAKIIQLLTKE